MSSVLCSTCIRFFAIILQPFKCNRPQYESCPFVRKPTSACPLCTGAKGIKTEISVNFFSGEVTHAPFQFRVNVRAKVAQL